MRFLLDENVPNMYMNSILYIKRRINIRLQNANSKKFQKTLAIEKNMQYN